MLNEINDLSLDDNIDGDVLTIDSDPYEGVLMVKDSPDAGTFIIRDDGEGVLNVSENEHGELSIEGDAYGGIGPTEDTAFDVAFDAAMEMHAPVEVVGAPLQLDSAFEDTLNERAALNVPLARKEPVKLQQREFALDTGPVFGPAGASTVVTLTPQCYFRAHKIMATDTGSPAGSATRITMVNVGQKVQRMGAGGTLTSFFAANALGNGVDFDTDHPWSQIQITVSFVQTCTFEMTLFGEAVI